MSHPNAPVEVSDGAMDLEERDLLTFAGAAVVHGYGYGHSLKGLLPSSEVWHPAVRAVLAAVEVLWEDGQAVNPLSVRSELAKAGEADQLRLYGGADQFFAKLAEVYDKSVAVDPAELAQIAVRCRAASLRRRIARGAAEVVRLARSGEEPDELIGRLERITEDERARLITPSPSSLSFPTLKIGDVVDPGPPTWMVAALWLAQAVGIVGADPKSLKSFFTIYVAVHVALGRPLFDKYPVKKGRVLIFNAEDSAPLTRFRIGGICRALDVDIGELDLHLVNTPSLFLDNPGHIDQLRRTVEASKPDLLILDPLRNLHCFDENDSTILPVVLTPLRLINREHGCAVQVVHHLVKANESRSAAGRLRGTGALRGWYDSAWILDRVEDGSVKVVVEHRGAEAPEPFCFELKSTTTTDGPAFWFDIGASTSDPSLEERVISFKASHPRVAGRAALASLRNQGVQFRDRDFWTVWGMK